MILLHCRSIFGQAWEVFSTAGGYFRRGNATLLIGVEDKEVEPTIQIIRDNCAEPSEPGLKRATVFVLDVDRIEQV